MTHNKMVQSDTERHQKRGKSWQGIEKEGLWEERRGWKLFVHQPV
jgi:hypothetical protein